MSDQWEPPGRGGRSIHERRPPIPVILATAMCTLAAIQLEVLAMHLQLDVRRLAEYAAAQDSDLSTAEMFGRVGALTVLRALAAAVLLAGGITVLFRTRTGSVIIAAGGIAGALCALFPYQILGKSQATVDHYTELFFGYSQRGFNWATLITCVIAVLLGALCARSALRSSRSGTRTPPVGSG